MIEILAIWDHLITLGKNEVMGENFIVSIHKLKECKFGILQLIENNILLVLMIKIV